MMQVKYLPGVEVTAELINNYMFEVQITIDRIRACLIYCLLPGGPEDMQDLNGCYEHCDHAALLRTLCLCIL